MPVPARIDGRYEVLARLGSGNNAQGEAYKVIDHNTDEIVALKLLGGVQVGPWHEAQQLTRLRDDHILPIRNADHASGVPYVVTALAEHGTVQDCIDTAPLHMLDLARVVTWTQQAAVAVVRTHDAGLLHTDIKPENLFLDDRDNVLLGDFGLASFVDANGLGHTSGTWATMAPEVGAAFASTSPRSTSVLSDVYSLGATAYSMLSGHAAFTPDVTAGEKGNGIRLSAHRPPRLRDLAPHVPRVLYQRVEQAMD